MKADVTDKGVLIPKELLDDQVKQVEIHMDKGRIIVIPIEATDPVFNLGKDSIDLDVTDASEQHDKYLYEHS